MFNFLKKQDTIESAIKALTDEARFMTDCIEKNTLQHRVSKLEKELKDTNLAVQELLELEKMSDEKIFSKYQYKRWDEVPVIIRNYIAKRYGFYVTHHSGLGIYCGPEQFVAMNIEPYMGQAFDKHKLKKEEFENV
jgi:hypothetical protein